MSVVADGSQSALLDEVTTIDSPIPVGKKVLRSVVLQ